MRFPPGIVITLFFVAIAPSYATDFKALEENTAGTETFSWHPTYSFRDLIHDDSSADFTWNAQSLLDLQRAFDLKFSKPLTASKFLFSDVNSGGNYDDSGIESFSSSDVFSRSPSFQWGNDHFSLPLQHQTFLLDPLTPARFDALGLQWLHELDPDNAFSVSAQFGDYRYRTPMQHDTAGTLASFGWVSKFQGILQPRLSGSVFLGDDTTKNDSVKFFGRRYYGVKIGGSVSLFQDHTPYASVQIERSDYAPYDPLYLGARHDDYSRLAAGWNWQISPNWGLRAEANRSFNNSNLDIYEYYSNQFLFSTRFDFR